MPVRIKNCLIIDRFFSRAFILQGHSFSMDTFWHFVEVNISSVLRISHDIPLEQWITINYNLRYEWRSHFISLLNKLFIEAFHDKSNLIPKHTIFQTTFFPFVSVEQQTRSKKTWHFSRRFFVTLWLFTGIWDKQFHWSLTKRSRIKADYLHTVNPMDYLNVLFFLVQFSSCVFSASSVTFCIDCSIHYVARKSCSYSHSCCILQVVIFFQNHSLHEQSNKMSVTLR